MRVGILVFDDVEEMDFAGPYEVFGVAASFTAKLEVTTVSKDGKAVRAKHGLRVQPDYSFSNCKPLDLLTVPGGRGARTKVMHDKESLDFIRAQSSKAHIASVCTGALVLAAAGLLDGHRATTHHEYWEALGKYPKVKVATGVRFVREDSVSTSAGITAGIDLSLEIVREKFGQDIVNAVVDEMEYEQMAQSNPTLDAGQAP